MSNEIKRDQQGVDRCQHIISTVMQNDPKNAALGFKKVQAYCNKPVTFSVSEGRKICPECDKQPPVGWVNPRITNSAGVSLTKKELEECGVKDGEDPSLKIVVPIKIEKKKREAKIAVEAKVKKEIKKDVVSFDVPLSVLEENGDVAAILIQRTIDAFGKLPVTNFSESKRLIKLEEKLRALLAV